MLYSCFDADRGIYRVFADENHRPVNGDLPVPKLPRDSGKVGVPSVDAARPLPYGVRELGESWNARGIVCSCDRRGALGAAPADPVSWAREHLDHLMVVGSIVLVGYLVHTARKG